MNKVLGACIRTRNYGSNPHGNVKKIDTMKTSPRSIYSQILTVLFFLTLNKIFSPIKLWKKRSKLNLLL